MNALERFRAYYAQHRVTVLAGGAAAVAALALYRRHQGSIGAATTAAPGVAALTSGPAGTTAPSTVDTSSYDLYDAVQSQLQGFANQLSTMQATGGATGIGATVPTQPTDPATPTAPPKAPTPAPLPMLSIAAPVQNADASFTSPAQITARLNEVLSNRNIPTASLPASIVASYTQQIANGQATIDQFRTAANSYASSQGQTAFRVP